MYIKQFDRFIATLNPSNTERSSFKEELRPWIGEAIEVQAYWICEDHERFSGQWAMWCHELHCWFPEEELSNMKRKEAA